MDPKKLSGVIMIVAIIVDVLWGFYRGRPLGLFGKRLGEELDCCFCRRDAFCHRQYHIQGWQ